MSEILFCGKQISDGGWVYGYPYSDGKKSYIAYEGKKDCIIHEVVPETLKPYTGLLDKNSQKIFEGNIIKAIWRYLSNIYTVVGIVKYDNAAFFLETDDHYLFFEDNIFSAECEVIGNIYDNPELIGGNQT